MIMTTISMQHCVLRAEFAEVMASMMLSVPFVIWVFAEFTCYRAKHPPST
jgi:hypothetical protein